MYRQHQINYKLSQKNQSITGDPATKL